MRIKFLTTRSVLLYLLFVVIAALFWCFITLNRTIQQDLTFSVEYVNVPNGVTMIDKLPKTINVTVKDKGSSFVKYYFSSDTKIKIRFDDFADNGLGMFKMTSVQLRNILKKSIGKDATIVSIYPESLNLKYTTLPGKKVPIRYDLDIEPDLKYVINGTTVTSLDSVFVYSDRHTLATIDEVYTYHVREAGLTDTLRRKVVLSPIAGARIIPNVVDVMVPIEQVIMKRKMVPVSVRNLPPGINVVVLPSTVEVSFLVPKSMFKDDGRDNDVTVVVDYNTIDPASKNNKAAISVGEAPAIYKNVEVGVDSVEYIIERH
ncbi:MAG: hypothetical protein II539_02230 [Muribaculaceae bacterium]|nr:hypothetical protein [Muribaculaceae bacterium]MBQ2490489.1 hypothetical protein [Muribaculaceae bacterium]